MLTCSGSAVAALTNNTAIFAPELAAGTSYLRATRRCLGDRIDTETGEVATTVSSEIVVVAAAAGINELLALFIVDIVKVSGLGLGFGIIAASLLKRQVAE